MQLARQIAHSLSANPNEVAIEFQGREITWREIKNVADAISSALDRADVPRQVSVGWLATNHPSMAAAAAALAKSERCISPVNPHLPPLTLTDELRKVRFHAVIGVPADWKIAGLVEACREAGSVAIVVDWAGQEAVVGYIPGLERLGPGPHREPMPDVALERLSSGTTGTPKRIPVTHANLLRAIAIVAPSSGAADPPDADVRLFYTPFSHAGGIWGLIGVLFNGRRLVLFEKFNVDEWVKAVKKYKPVSAGLVPTMLKMVVDANVAPEDIASIKSVRTSTAPLDPKLQELFEARYGIPILGDYGATEFIGGVAGWSLQSHRKYGELKRGSVGRAQRDVSLQIIDAETKEELPHGGIGLLRVKSPRWGEDWITTTDLASIDDDGFVFLHGRADEAIIRGGFKVLPEKVCEVLRLHPAVRDVGMLAVKDERLGQVPVAVIEPYPGAHVAAEELDRHAREHLPSYQVPVAFEFVDALPRTPSLKVSRPELKKMFAQKYEL
ncbi:MAG: AMP-binding protein [Caulobacteraceae bacterium]|nr:AMP-binding protein [Caulobacteraceae bacterium]